MDKITHEVRLANWKMIVEQCNDRPQGTTVKQWLADNDINEKTYYYWLRRVRREVYSQLNIGLPSVSGQDRPSVSFAEIPVKDWSYVKKKYKFRMTFSACLIITANSEFKQPTAFSLPSV